MKHTFFTRSLAAAAAIGMLWVVAPANAQTQSTTAQTSPQPSGSPMPCSGQTDMARSSTGDKPVEGTGNSSMTPSGPTSTTGVQEPTSPSNMQAKNNPCPSPSGSPSPSPN
jgi:hypothetical protein